MHIADQFRRGFHTGWNRCANHRWHRHRHHHHHHSVADECLWHGSHHSVDDCIDAECISGGRSHHNSTANQFHRNHMGANHHHADIRQSVAWNCVRIPVLLCTKPGRHIGLFACRLRAQISCDDGVHRCAGRRTPLEPLVSDVRCAGRREVSEWRWCVACGVWHADLTHFLFLYLFACGCLPI